MKGIIVVTKRRGHPPVAMKRYWTPPDAPSGGQQVLRDLFSVLSRVVPAAYFGVVCFGFWKSFSVTGKWTSLMWIVSEGLVILLLIFRRESRRLSAHPWDWAVALGGSFTVLLVRPTATAIVPDSLGVLLLVAGTVFEVHAKLFLGKSFGLVAADRGIVLNGPYRVVRHPIYLGYLVTHLGFLLTNWSLRNLASYLVVYGFQIARILAEERLLKTDGQYRAYCEQVRYRLVPGVF
jgi:protein-S-isoprenylcysteine O-methyltransferase Ste14